jgi:hypothetical protein
LDIISTFTGGRVARGGGFFSGIISWFIRVVIYDICITTIQNVLGVSRFTALMIFLGILLALSAAAYVIRQKASRGVDD